MLTVNIYPKLNIIETCIVLSKIDEKRCKQTVASLP